MENIGTNANLQIHVVFSAGDRETGYLIKFKLNPTVHTSILGKCHEKNEEFKFHKIVTSCRTVGDLDGASVLCCR